MKNNIFDTVLIIGIGLIGSSIARAIKKNKISSKIYGLDINKNVLEKCKEFGISSVELGSNHKHDRSFDYLHEYKFQYLVIY